MNRHLFTRTTNVQPWQLGLLTLPSVFGSQPIRAHRRLSPQRPLCAILETSADVPKQMRRHQSITLPAMIGKRFAQANSHVTDVYQPGGRTAPIGCTGASCSRQMVTVTTRRARSADGCAVGMVLHAVTGSDKTEDKYPARRCSGRRNGTWVGYRPAIVTIL